MGMVCMVGVVCMVRSLAVSVMNEVGVACMVMGVARSTVSAVSVVMELSIRSVGRR